MNEYGSLLIGLAFATVAFVSSVFHIKHEKLKRARNLVACRAGNEGIGKAATVDTARVVEEWKVGGPRMERSDATDEVVQKTR